MADGFFFFFLPFEPTGKPVSHSLLSLRKNDFLGMNYDSCFVTRGQIVFGMVKKLTNPPGK